MAVMTQSAGKLTKMAAVTCAAAATAVRIFYSDTGFSGEVMSMAPLHHKLEMDRNRGQLVAGCVSIVVVAISMYVAGFSWWWSVPLNVIKSAVNMILIVMAKCLLRLLKISFFLLVLALKIYFYFIIGLILFIFSFLFLCYLLLTD